MFKLLQELSIAQYKKYLFDMFSCFSLVYRCCLDYFKDFFVVDFVSK